MRKISAVVLCTLLVVGFTGCFGKSGDTGPISLVPSGVDIVGSVDVSGLLAIAPVKEKVDASQKNPEVAEMEKLGLKPENLKSLAFGVNLSSVSETNPEPDFIVAVQYTGELKKDEIKKKFAEDAGEKAKLEFIGTDMAVVGTPKYVDLAIKLSAGSGDAVSKNSSLMKVCEDKGGTLWFGADFSKLSADKLSGPASMAKDFKDAFVKVNYSAAGVLSLKIKLTGNDAEAMKKMKEGADKQLAGLEPIGIPKGAVTTALSGAVLEINAEFDKETVDKLAKMLPMMLMGGMGGMGGGAPQPE